MTSSWTHACTATRHLNANCIWSFLLRNDAIQNTRTECRTALFWVIIQRALAIPCRRFGTTYRSQRRKPIDPTIRVLTHWPWRWDRQVVQKRRQVITSARCVMPQKSAVLICFSAEAFQHAAHSAVTCTCSLLLSKWLLCIPAFLYGNDLQHYYRIVGDAV